MMDEITLKEYFDSRLCELRKHTDLRIDALKDFYAERFRIIEKETEQARLLIRDKMIDENRVREQLREQNLEFEDKVAHFITKEEHKHTVDDVKDLQLSRAELTGKASQTSFFISLVLTLIALGIGLVALLR